MAQFDDRLFTAMLARVFTLFGSRGKHAGELIDSGSLFSHGGIKFSDPTNISRFLARAQSEGWLVRVSGQRSQGGFKTSGTRGYQLAEGAHERFNQLNSADEQADPSDQIQALKAKLDQQRSRAQEFENRLKAERAFTTDLEESLKSAERRLAELEESKRVLEEQVAKLKKQQPDRKSTNGVSELDRLMRLLEARIVAVKQEAHISRENLGEITGLLSDGNLQRLLVMGQCMPAVLSALFDAYTKLEEIRVGGIQPPVVAAGSSSFKGKLHPPCGVDLHFGDEEGPTIRMSRGALTIPTLRKTLSALFGGES